MILDIERFIAERQESWRELESLLDALERDPAASMDMERIQRFHHLARRTAADLVKLRSFADEPELKRYLESLVARSFAEMHEARRNPVRIAPFRWLLQSFPMAFRRRFAAFLLAAGVMLMGAVLGGGLLMVDPEAKEVLLPFEHLQGSPSERVAREELGVDRHLDGRKATFSAELMTHNIKVTIVCMAMGMTMGIGTLILLFYNGVILGAVALDYLRAGQAAFLFGWLLPHGSVEIPAVLLGGQAGLLLAGALMGRSRGTAITERLRLVSSDLITLVGGAAVMLVWAGIIEAFFSQYHEPVLPYGLKIGFGAVELIVLGLLLSMGGRGAGSELGVRSRPGV